MDRNRCISATPTRATTDRNGSLPDVIDLSKPMYAAFPRTPTSRPLSRINKPTGHHGKRKALLRRRSIGGAHVGDVKLARMPPNICKCFAGSRRLPNTSSTWRRLRLTGSKTMLVKSLAMAIALDLPLISSTVQRFSTCAPAPAQPALALQAGKWRNAPRIKATATLQQPPPQR